MRSMRLGGVCANERRRTWFFSANATSAGKSSGEMSSTLDVFGSWDVPAFPGQTYVCSRIGDFAIFHARACSLPPAPMIRTRRAMIR